MDTVHKRFSMQAFSACLFAVLLAVFSPTAIGTNDGVTADQVLARWSAQILRAGGTPDQLAQALEGASQEQLQAAAAATTPEELDSALLGPGTGGAIREAAGIDGPEFLGDTDKDFVYTAVPPCRIVDTRFGPAYGGAPVPPGGIIPFNVYGNVAAQNGGAGVGNPVICPSPRGEPRAVHMNVTAVPGGSGGNLRAFPSGSLVPNASLVNYRPNTNIANAGTVQTLFSLVNPDVDLFSSQTSHVIVDVMGYYHEVDPKDLVRGNHAGYDEYTATIPPGAPYLFVDELISGGGYDDDPSNAPPGFGDILTVEEESDVMVQATMQVWVMDAPVVPGVGAPAQIGAPFEGEITPCFRVPGAPPEDVIPCVALEGPEAETDFCFTSYGVFDQRSVQTSCIFRDMPAGLWEFGVCAKTVSSYGCLNPPGVPYNVGGVKVDITKLPE